ncbi:MAG TPA: tyrosine-protein phosphatase [Chloroflexota bacterium]|nr:tyrosine-protein phosphatase [Chloroflexota bacterium]
MQSRIATLARSEHRRLSWDGCVNVRDLGGLPTEDGQHTRLGVFVRSDGPDHLTEVGETDLQEYRIRTIVDLRLPEEAEEYTYPFATPGEHGIAYHNISFIDPAYPPDEEPPDLASDYRGMLDRFGHRVREVMETFARAPEGCTLFHCAAGKDRTGLVAALLLDLANVSPDIIAADYGLTAEYRRSVTDEYLVNGPGSRADREMWLRFTWPHPKVMANVLEHLATRYGRAEGYLLHIGVDAMEIASLREKLVEGDLTV